MPLRRIHACKDPNSAPRQRFSRVALAAEGRGRRAAQDDWPRGGGGGACCWNWMGRAREEECPVDGLSSGIAPGPYLL